MIDTSKVGLDALHVVLITGFVSTIVGLIVHVATKWSMQKGYITRFECISNRSVCALADIKVDIEEIKQIQRRRTEYLFDRATRDDLIWREVMDALKIPMSRQNTLLITCRHPGAEAST